MRFFLDLGNAAPCTIAKQLASIKRSVGLMSIDFKCLSMWECEDVRTGEWENGRMGEYENELVRQRNVYL